MKRFITKLNNDIITYPIFLYNSIIILAESDTILNQQDHISFGSDVKRHGVRI